MKAKMLPLLTKLIAKLQDLEKNWIKSEKKVALPFTALSPLSDADIEHYKQSLDWAVSNRESQGIYNIALTGAYGSGKSSILKTFSRKNRDKNLHFLNISLATFKESIPVVVKDDEKKTEKQQELLRLIELSILQQIFFHEKDEKIPDSRFKKIKSFSRLKLFWVSVFSLLAIGALLYLLFPTYFIGLLNLPSDDKTKEIIGYVCFGISVLAVFLIIFRSIRIVSALQVSKLQFQNAAIEMDKDVRRSILNHHLDEILYFFEVRPYNIVVIEDLDRFEQTEIFTKLREINQLLNHSKKINRHIVFIYAVRDDMFKGDKDRTKFFDFIIPVIPVINFSNSSQKLLDKQELFQLGFTNDVVENVALFIDDMRLLHNVINEYYLYHQKLAKNIIPDKLLAILVYKNIYPEDFAKLSYSDGELYKTISSKHLYITNKIKTIDLQIDQKAEEIQHLEKIKIKDVKELRLLYLSAYVNSLNGFLQFSINGTTKLFDEMVEDEMFDYIIHDKAQFTQAQPATGYGANMHRVTTQPIGKKFAAIEKHVDATEDYQQRYEAIQSKSKNRTETLKPEILKLEESKRLVHSSKIKDLLHEKLTDIKVENLKQKELIGVLLRNGYIDEDYMEYISIFYEGSLMRTDYQFLLNVKSQIITPYDFVLQRLDNLLVKLPTFEFDKDYILNYDLLAHMLADDRYEVQRSLFFRQLSNESPSSVAFIFGYIDSGKDPAPFIIKLAKAWESMWAFLDERSNLPEEKKQKYFSLILNTAEAKDVKRLAQRSTLVKAISSREDFLSIVRDAGKLKAIILELNLKFTKVKLEGVDAEIIDYIYENEFYKINDEMITRIIKAKGKFDQTIFDRENYRCIKTSGCKALESYVDENINEYLTDVYFKLPTNVEESKDHLLDMLNNEDVTQNNKALLIHQLRNRIPDLKAIEDVNIKGELLSQSKVQATWENLLDYFEVHENKITEEITLFLNNRENATALSGSVITDEGEYAELVNALLHCNEILDESYALLLKSIEDIYLSDLTGVDDSHVRLLAEHDVISFDPAIFDYLKANHSSVVPTYFEQNKTLLLKDIANYNLEGDDVLAILKSGKFTNIEKSAVINEISEGLIQSDKRLSFEIGKLLLSDSKLEIPATVVNFVLQNVELGTEARVFIFNAKEQVITNESIEQFLISLGEPFAEITINDKRPRIPSSTIYMEFAQLLARRKIISSYDPDEKGIRIYTFKK